MPTSALTGLVAVVTGASRGIGRGVALHLAHRGATVVADALGPTWTAEPQDWWDAVTVDLLGTMMITAKSAIRRMMPLASRSRWPANLPRQGSRCSRCIRDSGDQGRAWLPGFGDGPDHRWGGPGPAAELVEAIAGGAADELTGRVLWAGDDIDVVAARCRSDPDYRRLRLVTGHERRPTV
jgi:hypothetical protein